MNIEKFTLISNACGIIKNIIFLGDSINAISNVFIEEHHVYNVLLYNCNANEFSIITNGKAYYIHESAIDFAATIIFLTDNDYMYHIYQISKFAKHVVGSFSAKDSKYFDYFEVLRPCVENIYFDVIEENRTKMFRYSRHLYKYEVSIILPVYNVSQYLRQCIESLQAWDAPYIEFIAVDDGSTDDSVLILEEMQNSDNRIKIIHKDNGGCASARQLGLDKAQGNFVAFFDPDDFAAPKMFKYLYKAMLFGEFDVAFCGYTRFYQKSPEKSAPSPELFLGQFENGTYDKDSFKNLLVYSDIAIWRCLYSHNFLCENNIRFLESIRRYDDLPFHKEVMLKARAIITVNKPLYYYRLGRPDQDVSCTDERLFVHFDISNHLDKIFKDADSESYEYLLLSKVNTHAWALGKIDKNLYNKYSKEALKDIASRGHVSAFKIMSKYFGVARAVTFYFKILKGYFV